MFLNLLVFEFIKLFNDRMMCGHNSKPHWMQKALVSSNKFSIFKYVQ